MRSLRFLVLAGAVALMAALGVTFFRAGHGRQYYDKWQQSAKGYAFSVYHYRPEAGDATYRTNYAIYYPSTPQYVYYFNPAKGTYWGRYDLKTKGYSLLAEKDRAGLLKDIPESAFPAEGALPGVPDAKDKLTLAEPPDLPSGEKVDNGARPADKVDELATAVVDDKTAPAGPPADAKADKPAGPATPAGPAASAGQAPPADRPVVDAKPGVGVVPPTEPASPAGGVAPAPGGTPAPVGGVVAGGASKVEPNGFPFHPGCHRHSCH
jgi:hypothetical protein